MHNFASISFPLFVVVFIVVVFVVVVFIVVVSLSLSLLSPLGDLEMDLSGDIPIPIQSVTFRFDCSKRL